MSNQVTTHASWSGRTEEASASCWNCEVGSYIVYYSDLTQTPRCGRCGELERDDPAKKTRPVEDSKTKPAPQRRTYKPKEKA